MVTAPIVIFMVVAPVTSLLGALVVVSPIISRSAAIVSCVMPFPVVPVAFFPLSALPITTPVVVPVAIPARTNDNSGLGLDIHLLGRGVDWLRCVDDTGDFDVYANIDVGESNGR
jgi:hypothetical protein